MMNRVISATWTRLSCEAGKTIKSSFSKTKLVPLKPPATQEFAATAALSSLQCGSGKKAAELNVAITDSLVKVRMNIVPKEDVVVLTAAKNSNRNLLIRSVVFDAINKSLVILAQEFKDIQQQISNARKLKICAATITESTS